MLDITQLPSEIDNNMYKLVHWYAALIDEINLYEGEPAEKGSELFLFRKAEPAFKAFLEQKGCKIKNGILYYQNKEYTLNSRMVDSARKLMPAIIRCHLPEMLQSTQNFY